MSNPSIQRNGPNDRPHVSTDQILRGLAGAVKQETHNVRGQTGAPSDKPIAKPLGRIFGRK
jgi:hypothetical protein